MTLNLALTERYTSVKYAGPKSYPSEDMANVKVFVDKQRDKRMYRQRDKQTGQQEGHDGPVSLHWLIREIPSYQMIQYMGIGLKT